MRKRKLAAKYMLVAAIAAISLSACGSKTKTEVPAEQETAVEETVDPFAINGTEGIAVIPEGTEIAEVTETQANGLRSGVLTNGDGFVEMNEPGKLGKQTQESEAAEDEAQDISQIPETLPLVNDEFPVDTEAARQQAEKNKYIASNAQSVMSEEELTTYDVVVTFWCEHPDLSEEYLTEMLGSAERFSSLSDEQRNALIEEVKTVYPHVPEETKAYDTYFEQ